MIKGLCYFVILLILILVPSVYGEEEKKFQVTLSPSQTEALEGETITMIVKIKNVSNATLTLDEHNVVLVKPFDWPQDTDESEPPTIGNITIHPNANKIVKLKLKIPEGIRFDDADKREYNIIATVTININGVKFEETAESKITVKNPSAPKLTLENVKIDLSSASEQIRTNEPINMIATISNSNAKHMIMVTNVQLLPKDWITEKPDFNTVTVEPKGSRIFQFVITPPSNVKEGKYPVVVQANFAYDGSNFIVEKEKYFTVKDFYLNLNWDNLIILFLIYGMFGSILERALNPLFSGTRKDETTKPSTPQPTPQPSTSGERGTPKRKFSRADIFVDQAGIRANKEQIRILKEIVKDPKQPKSNIEEATKGIEKATKNIANEQVKRENRITVTMLGFAFIPAYLLAFFGLGLLAMLNIPEYNYTLHIDAIIGALAITFTSKPTHDIVRWLQAIKERKMP